MQLNNTAQQNYRSQTSKFQGVTAREIQPTRRIAKLSLENIKRLIMTTNVMHANSQPTNTKPNTNENPTT